jgi:hypothetical protein
VWSMRRRSRHRAGVGGAKTDGINGKALARGLLAYKRSEPRVCATVQPPTPKEEDYRRLCRERKVLFSQGITRYGPLRRVRRTRWKSSALATAGHCPVT